MQATLNTLFNIPRPVALPAMRWPMPLAIAVLAPHPDDFDAIAVSLRHLHAQGHAIDLAVLTTGANGIEDGWCGATDDAAKAAIREEEQQASCALFGLPPDRLTFLRLWTGGDDRSDDLHLRAWLLQKRPDLVFLPHGNDSNRTHRRTWQTFETIAREESLQLVACMNLDAKTQGMRHDLYMPFDETDAAWKAGLLRCHRSQQERNLKTRGHGFDERVLAVNRAAAETLESAMPYAEVFEVERFGQARRG